MPIRYKMYISLSFIIFCTSCNNLSQPFNSQNAPLGEKVAFAVHGVLMDQGLHELALKGFERAKYQFGYQLISQVIDNPSDFSSYLDNLYTLNNDLIISVDFTLWEKMYEQAFLHPDQKFIIIDYTEIETPLDNLLTVGFRAQECSFLAGYLAGKMTKTNKIGFVGGIKGSIIDMFDYGYEAGAKYANPQIVVIKQYTEDFNNPPLGKVVASYMYQDGVDVIFQAAGATGLGVIEAAKELENKGVWVIGVDDDQSSLGPEVVLTSALKRVDNVIYTLLESYKEGLFMGGSTLELGLAEGALELSRSPHIPSNIEEELANLTQKIIKGEIKIPYNERTYQDFCIF